MNKKIFVGGGILVLVLAAAASFFCLKFIGHNSMNKEKDIRQPAVAGQFYPAASAALRAQVEKYLAQAASSPDLGVRAIIVPHAGYDFSAPVAASAYKTLAGRKLKTVFLLGASHVSYFSGAAIDDHDAWRTPLGDIEVDLAAAKKIISADPEAKFERSAHAGDHILEVQLPFLQTVLAGGFKIVPISLGEISSAGRQDLAKALAGVLGPDDLVVISTDMSHYPAYKTAQEIDRQTLEIIKEGEAGKLEQYISQTMAAGIANEETVLCGAAAVELGLDLAPALGWQAEVLHYANSGDVPAGDRETVVGYGAIVFKLKDKNEKLKMMEDKLNLEQQKKLLEIARTTVETYVKTGQAADFKISDERLNRPEGVFVTLNKRGALRGCIGLIVSPGTPLWQNVREMAIAAATEDGRFMPVSEEELPDLEYEISVLSAPQEISDWRRIKLGAEGVIISRGRNKGVFLPQVATETGWSLEEFLSQICAQKAGLPADCYKNDPQVKIEVFSAQVIS